MQRWFFALLQYVFYSLRIYAGVGAVYFSYKINLYICFGNANLTQNLFLVFCFDYFSDCWHVGTSLAYY